MWPGISHQQQSMPKAAFVRPPSFLVCCSLVVFAFLSIIIQCLELQIPKDANNKHAFNLTQQQQQLLNFSIPVTPPANLFTVVKFPEFNLNGKTKLDLVLEKTPYGTKTLSLEETVFTNAQFAYAGQDNRGCHQSSGNYSIWRTETIDTQQTIEFLMTELQDRLSGKVFSYGASADAISAYFQPRVKSPYLAGQCLVVGTANVHKFVYQNGAFRQQDISMWLQHLARQPQSLPIIMEHEGMSEFWESNTLRSGENVTFPSLHMGGWNDLFLDGTMNAFKMYRANRPHDTYLIIVPTGHCQKSEISYPEQELMLHPEVFCPYLFKYSSLPFLDKVTLYIMGPNSLPSSYEHGNYYVTLPDFPETEPLHLYLTPSGQLSRDQPPPSMSSNLTYLYNPTNPTPTLGGNNLFVATCGPYDQRPNEARPDNLIFTSELFEQNTLLMGSMTLSLRFSSNCTDTDVVVRVSDVYPEPDSRSMLLSDSIVRMRWRHGGSEKKLLIPNEVYELNIELWPTAYLVLAKHRLRVAITSSNYPRFSVNPNNGMDLRHDRVSSWSSSSVHGTMRNRNLQETTSPNEKEWPLINALNTVHLDGSHPSVLTLPRVKDMNMIQQARQRFETFHKQKLEQLVTSMKLQK
ncbi:hypothetical protein C9374_001587 [Naegleria lovaniensis]|uniref:Xaa-Pro dipeptidyl-peptidase C-terminal domain-containing protein n=1 Tax=Naegleria lovaniensis TaxID=51637 RepID=A0AA88GUP7_NAELO|nr:uncharacterized protein C9374_001587 [Naegleria lovaniensis]KAG2387255.1 hypothetical protein C9374_001587 [Naegleria lovaniensis]